MATKEITHERLAELKAYMAGITDTAWAHLTQYLEKDMYFDKMISVERPKITFRDGMISSLIEIKMSAERMNDLLERGS